MSRDNQALTRKQFMKELWRYKKGSINLSFTACRDMLPDPAFYADCLQASFEELRDAALSVSGKKRRKVSSGK